MKEAKKETILEIAEPTPLTQAEIEELFDDESFLLRITNQDKFPEAYGRRRRLRTRLGQLAFR